MTLITQDVTKLTGSFILIHVVNNRNVMGAGVAKAISDTWPEVKGDYHAFFDKPTLDPVMGAVILSQVAPAGYVLSLIAQDGYGNDGKRYLDYPALSDCLDRVVRIAGSLGIAVYAPFNMGCGLAGGDWPLVKTMVESKLPNIFFCQQ